MRFVNGHLVFRLTSVLAQNHIQRLKEKFQDILVPQGNIVLSGPLSAEKDETEISHLPRLVVDFNRQNFGRLRSLIDAINDF
jgi:hypothetical protein